MNPSAIKGEGNCIRSSSYETSKVATAGVAICKKPTAQTRRRGYRLRLSGAMVAAVVAVLLILGTGAAQPAQAQVESVLHSFKVSTSDGFVPAAGLIMDSSGNLYGTTALGGSSTKCGSYGCGTFFELVKSSTGYSEKVLFNFTGTNGFEPAAGLIMDSAGNLYGTTYYGGSTYVSPTSPGDGTVFELTQASGYKTEKVLHSFSGYNSTTPASSDGGYPKAPLIMDSSGNLFGTTAWGGSSDGGTVFELKKTASGNSSTDTVLLNFKGTNGLNPQAGLIMDSAGNLYGTTVIGGSTYTPGGTTGDGTVFELKKTASGYSSTDTVLFNFTGSNGKYPWAGLIMNSAGNLYGTTYDGGSTYTPGGTAGDGTVFELKKTASGYSSTDTVLFNFNGTDGASPQAGLIMDSTGNLYGTTLYGGSTYTSASSPGDGTVFELVKSSAGYSGKVLVSFNGANGDHPAGPIMDSAGNLYGTTPSGGSTYQSASNPGHGTVFGIAPVKLSATSLSFGSVAVDTTSATQGVTVTNIGANSLSYGAASLSGANAADFAITSNTCNAAVAPNGTCSASVTFAPSTTTAEVASLNLTEAGLTQTVSLSGTGVYPMASFSSSSLNFPSRDVGTTSSAQTVTLTNQGTVPLTITSVGITGDFAMASNTCKASVAAGKSCTVGVTFSPTAGGTRTGTLSFTDNASNSPQTVALSGAGEDFTLTPRTTSESVADGGSTGFDLLLSPQGGFNQSISLACSNAPAHATCTVNPTSVTLDGTNATSIQVKVSTAGNALVAPGPGDFGPPPSGSLPLTAWLAIIGLLGLMALVKFSPRGGRVRRAAPWATLALAAALFAGCGGGSIHTGVSSANSTPAGTYTLTVKATSGSLSQSTQITLNVQ